MKKILSAFMLVSTVLMSGCISQVNTTVAQNGVLDLRDKSFSDNEIYALKGEWDFYWQRIYSVGNFELNNKNSPKSLKGWQKIKVPFTWAKKQVKGDITGYATYHLRVLVPQTIENFGLVYEQITSAAKIFINGVEVKEVGKFSTRARDEIPQLYSNAVYFHNEERGVVDIVIYVSNFFHPRGGINMPLSLGKKQVVETYLLRKRSFEIFFLGSFLIISFYYLMLFFYQRFEHSTLIFALLSFDVGIRIFSSGQKVAPQVFPFLSANFFIHLEYISWYFGATLFLHFLMLTFDYLKYRKFVFLNYLISFGFSFFALFTPPMVFAQTLKLFQIIFALQILSCFYFIFKAYLDKKYGTKLLVAAAVVMILFVFYDILVAANLLPQIGLFLAPYGILLFFYAQISLMAQRFYDSFHKSIFLSEKLEKKNQDFLRLDTLKDEFLLNTSIKLKSPLMGILGITDYMLSRQETISESDRKNLLTISSFSNQLLTQINDSLDFSRILHQDIKLNIAVMELNKVLLPALSMWNAYPKQKDITIDNNIKNIFYVYGDESRLHQNIYNLLHFVYHYSVQGAIQLNTRKEYENLVIDFFSDSFSLHIPNVETVLSDIHSVFSSQEDFVDDISKNYLFSLSIVAKLLQLQKGKLQPIIEKNNKIKGFSIVLTLGNKEDMLQERAVTLPPSVLSGLVEAKELESSSTDNMFQKEFFSSAQTGKFHVLLISSDPVISSIAANYLRTLKITTEIMEGGQRGLNSLMIDASFDLIVVDSVLDDMSGYEFCRKAREDYAATELPVLMITLSNRMNEVFAVFESGANDYVSKPFEKNEFLVRINLLLTFKEAVIERKKIGTMEKELKLAKKIQDSLLPKEIPKIPDIRFATLYLPMSMIGGDYYDIQKVSDTSFAVLVADVSGHGVPAAIIASMLKIAIQHHADLLPFPGKLLSELNRDLSENLENNFLTAAYAYFDLEKKTVTMARAGHPPILTTNRNVPEIIAYQPQGRLIGFYKNSDYEEKVVTLKDGDRFIFYSDGITEISRSDNEQNAEREEYGDRQFPEFIRMGASLRAREFVSLLIENLFDYSGLDTFDDDLTMVVVDYTPQENKQ